MKKWILAKFMLCMAISSIASYAMKENPNLKNLTSFVSMGNYGFQRVNYGSLENEIVSIAKNLPKDGNVLEVGAGYGRLSLDLLKISKAKFFVNDLDPKTLALLKYVKGNPNNRKVKILTGGQNVSNRLHLIPGNALDIRNNVQLKKHFDSNSLLTEKFDLIIVLHTVQYFSPKSIVEFMGDMAELLKPGGKLVVSAESDYYSVDEKVEQNVENISKLLNSGVTPLFHKPSKIERPYLHGNEI